MYKIIRETSFETECVEKCYTLEELDEALQSHLLLMAHLGYVTRVHENGFDVLSQGDLPIVVSHFRIEEDGKE